MGRPGQRLGEVKKQLQATGEEWKVIGPALQKVIQARQVVATGIRGGDETAEGSRFFPGFRGPPGGPPTNGAFGGPVGGGPNGRPRGEPDRSTGDKPSPNGPDADRNPEPNRTGESVRPDDRNRRGEGAPSFGGNLTGPPGGEGPADENPIRQAQLRLRTAIGDGKSTASEIADLIAAVRAAKKKAQADLGAAESELNELLTPAQAQVLLGWGYLE